MTDRAAADATEQRPPAPREVALLDRLADWTLAERGLRFRWGFVALAFAVATGLRLVLDPYLSVGLPFVTYFPAVAVTAFVAGPRAGAVLAALCFLASWYLFIPPVRSFAVEPAQIVALALYVVVVGTEVGLVFLMRRALRRMALAEAQAREEARSRTLMFHELQHRVSNNLAVVGSLLALQRREVGDPDAQHALDVAAARLNVVSRLNRLLHNPDAQAVEFGAFLRAVVPDAVTAAGTGDRVHVSVQAEPVVVPADKAVPLGLVATELLANALEHGFPGERRGNVCIALAMQGRRALLEIRDDGVGLPDGFALAGSRSLGLQIARQFAGQLDADLSVEADGGVVSRLMVPLG